MRQRKAKHFGPRVRDSASLCEAGPAYLFLRTFLYFIACLFVFGTEIANAATVRWNTDSSGSWHVSSNWDSGTVPTINDDVIIDRPSASVTVTISTANAVAKSLQCTESLIVNTAQELRLAATSTISGSFSLNGNGKLRAENSGTIVSVLGTTDTTNGLFQVLSGAEVRVPNLTTWDTQGAGSVAVASVVGAGSKLSMPNVTLLKAGVFYPYGGAQTQDYEAKDGGIIDFSKVDSLLQPDGTTLRVRFTTTNSGKIQLPVFRLSNQTTVFNMSGESNPAPNLQSVGGLVFTGENGVIVTFPALTTVNYNYGAIDVVGGSTLNLPSLTSLSNSAITIRAGGILNAPLLTDVHGSVISISGNGLFNCGLLTDITNTRFVITGGAVFNRVVATTWDTQGAGSVAVASVIGAGSRLELSTLTTLKAGVDYPFGGSQTQYYEARDGGVIDFGHVDTLLQPVGTTLRVEFVTSNGGRILLPVLRTSNQTTIFNMPDEPNPAPSLQSVGGLVFTGKSGVSVTFPSLTTLNYNYGAIDVVSGSTLNLPSLTSLSNSAVTIRAGGILNAPLFTDVHGSVISISGNGLFNCGLLTDITNTRFVITGGAVFNRVVATTWDTQGAGSVAVASVLGAGSRLDLSSVTTLNAGVNYPFGGSQTQYYEARDGGIIDFSHVDALLQPVGTTLRVEFVTSNGGRILLPVLRISNQTTIFNMPDEPNPAPSLQSVGGLVLTGKSGVSVTFPLLTTLNYNYGAMDIVGGSTLSLPSLTSLSNSALTIRAGGILNAPLLTDVRGTLISIAGNGLFNCGLLTDITDTRFAISGGAVFDRVIASDWNTQGAGITTIATVTGTGSLLDLSSLSSLHTGTFYPFGDSSVQAIEATGGGRIDLGNAVNWVQPFGTTRGTSVLADSGGSVDISAVQFIRNGPYHFTAQGLGSLIDLRSACTYESTTFAELNGGVILRNGIDFSSNLSNAIFGIRSAGQTTACSGNSCSQSELFSFFADGRCYQTLGTVMSGTSQVDVDGLAVSPSFGVVGFELIHSTLTGAITGSRLVGLDQRSGNVISTYATLANREIRGAAFVGDNLFALDVVANSILRVGANSGAILEAPWTLTLSGANYDVGPNADFSVKPDGSAILVDGQNWFNLDLLTGNLTPLFVDSQILADGTLPAYTGAAFGADPGSASFRPIVFTTPNIDTIFDVPSGTARRLLLSNFGSSFPSKTGDLASMSTNDSNAPGPVTISINPNGDGTTAVVSWSGYDEAANGNDIYRYQVYRNASLFVDTSVGTLVGTTPAGTKQFTLDGLTRGQTIYIAVNAIDRFGNVNRTVVSMAVTPVDIVPPTNVSNIGVSSAQTSLGVSWQVPPNGTSDATGARVYRNGTLVSGTLPISQTSFAITGLTSKTGYSIRVTLVDGSGNENSGVTVSAATLLPNPNGVQVVPGSAKGRVSWLEVVPTSLLAGYRIYAEEAPFSSVAGKTPRATAPPGVLSKDIGGLQNGVTYYFAVTAVNISNGQDPNVTVVQTTPASDTVGPSISQRLFNSNPIVNGALLSTSGTLKVVADDVSGMSHVDLFLTQGITSRTIATLLGAGPTYQAAFEPSVYPPGAYSLHIRAFDSVGNQSEEIYPITLGISAPSAPQITAPASGLITNQAPVLITVRSQSNCTVQLLRGGIPLGTEAATTPSGEAQFNVNLVAGGNSFEAIARNSGGSSPKSSAVLITLNESLPSAPKNLSAIPQAGGQIFLSWNAGSESESVSYDVYRSNQAFVTLASATKITSTLLTNLNYRDVPSVDGTYYYRVVARNGLGSSSEASEQVSALSDSVAPRVTGASFSSTGPADLTTRRFGPGVVTIRVTVSEELSSLPFVSVTIPGGVPTAVTLRKVSPTIYDANFTINSFSVSGAASILFSGMDLVGNRGTQVDPSATFTVDAEGPTLDSISVSPISPIETSAASPRVITVQLSLSEFTKTGTSPVLQYLLSASGRSPVAVSPLTQDSVNQKIWRGAFTLPADAGRGAPENLSFLFSAEDSLGNVSTRVLGANQFQVYQGSLPPVAIPTGLSATAKAQGKVALKWNSVAGASQYQIFRRGPDAASNVPLVALGGRTSATEILDQTSGNGLFEYSVASIRTENGEEALSAQSEIVAVVSDSSAPNPPLTLSLVLEGRGVHASWNAPSGGTPANGVLTYNLYRAALSAGVPMVTAGRAPVVQKITSLDAVDPLPSLTEHSYAVTAIDEAGNESSPSNTVYLNFSLLPVSTLEISRLDSAPPKISWTHANAPALRFKVDIDDAGGQTTIFTGNQLQVSDNSYSVGERLYTVRAIDEFNAESAPRSLLLPNISLERVSGEQIQRGIFNRVQYRIENVGATSQSHVQVVLGLAGEKFVSEVFNLSSGETKNVELVIPGKESLSAVEPVVETVRIDPNQGERIEISKSGTLGVTDGALFIALETENFVRGAQGRARFVLRNTSEVSIEIVTARQSGAQSSPDIRFRLVDIAGNNLSVTPFLQQIGGGVTNLPNGETIARINPGAEFISAWSQINVPEATSDGSILVLDIDHFYFGKNATTTLSLNGHGTSSEVPVTLPPYSGVIDSISPLNSFGDVPIVIRGRSVQIGTNSSIPGQPLELVLRSSGFEEKIPVLTDGVGAFSYSYLPSTSRGGAYTASAIFPGFIERPNQGQFTIQSLTIVKNLFEARTPKNYELPIDIEFLTGPATTAANVRLQYLATDQALGQLSAGIQLALPPAISLQPGEQKKITVKFSGDKTAQDVGSVRLRAVSDTTGSTPIGFVTINYLFSSAAPSIRFTPTTLETGAAVNSTTHETIVLANNGLAPVVNGRVSLLRKLDGAAAPRWIFVSSPQEIERLEIGESLPVELTVSPDNSVPAGYYDFLLRVEVPDELPQEMLITVGVTLEGKGNVLLKVNDIYTGTIGTGGAVIPGLGGASVKIQNEDVLGIERSGVTDSAGEIQFNDLPAGNYLVRASASNHNDTSARLKVKPGITTSTSLFLMNGVVTIEWSVREIPIEDRYEIVLEAIFETNVPAPVLVFEPVGTQLPDLKRGEVFYGEMVLTNYGLIEARHIQSSFPTSDERARYEFFGEVPATLGPNDRAVIPYRITALQDFKVGAQGVSSGGGSCDYSQAACVKGDATCASGDTVGVGACTHWLNTGSCPITSSGPGAVISPSGSGGGSASWAPKGEPLPESRCIPGVTCDVGASSPNS